MTSSRQSRRVPRHTLAWFVALLFITLRGAAFADDVTTGSVRISLTDSPGTTASVDLSFDVGGDATSPRRWTATIDDKHAATFRRLPLATYIVRVGTTSGGSADITVHVGVASIVSLEVSIPAAGGAPEIVVAESALRGEGVSFDDAALRDLPSGDDIWALLDAAEPFVIVDRIDNGGLGNARAGLVGGRGASWTSTTLFLGNVELGPPTPAETPIYPDLRAIEGVRVYAGLAPPEIGSPGTAVALAPRRPGAVFRGAFDASFSSPELVSHNVRAAAPAIGRLSAWRDVNLQIGGPVAPRAGFFVSATTTTARMYERSDPARVKTSVDSLLGHLVTTLTDRDEIRLLATVQRRAHPFDGRVQFSDRGAQQRDRLWQSQVTWDHAGSAGTQEWSVGFLRSETTPGFTSDESGTMDRVFDGPIPSPPTASATERLSARVGFDAREVRRLGTVRVSAAYARQVSRSHVVALPAIAELVDSLPARVWVPSAPDGSSSRRISSAVATISDELRAGPRFTLDVGLRVELANGSAAGAAQRATWRSLSPRLSFRWAPKRVTVFGGFARYHRTMTTDLLAFGDPGEPAVQVYRWDDPNANRRFDEGEAGLLVERAGRDPGTAGLDTGLRAPRTDEFSLGLEYRFTPRMRLSATATIRNERDLLAVVDTGAPRSSYTAVTVHDQDLSHHEGDRSIDVYDRLPSTFGSDQYLLTNVRSPKARYRGIEAFWEVRTPRWYTMAGASAYRVNGPGGNTGFRAAENDQGVLGNRFSDPNAGLVPDGRLFFDRAYVFKWSTSYHAPRGLMAAVTARYQDGQPFSRLILIPTLAQGAEAITADESGSTRFTFEATIDVRLEQRFSFGRRGASIRLDVFNLPNRANEIEENPVAGPLFRQTTAVQPARTFRLGVHVDF